MLAAGGGDSQQQREEKRIGSNVLVGSIHPSFVNSRVNVERIRWQCVFCYFAQAVILVLDSTQPSRRRGAWPWGGVNSESVHMATKPATHPRVNLAVTPLLVTPYSSCLSSHTGIRRELTLSLSRYIYISGQVPLQRQESQSVSVEGQWRPTTSERRPTKHLGNESNSKDNVIFLVFRSLLG